MAFLERLKQSSSLLEALMSETPFGFEQPKDSPGFSLWQVTTLWQRVIKQALEPYGLSHAQFVILAVLLWLSERREEVTQVMLIDWTKLDKMTVSKSLKKLSNEGFVTRTESVRDSRAKCVRLTPDGDELVKKLIPIVEGIDERFFSPLGKGELRNFLTYLESISSMTR